MKVYWSDGQLRSVEVVQTEIMIRTADTGETLPGGRRQLPWPTWRVHTTASKAWAAYLEELHMALLRAQQRVRMLEKGIHKVELLRSNQTDNPY